MSMQKMVANRLLKTWLKKVKLLLKIYGYINN